MHIFFWIISGTYPMDLAGPGPDLSQNRGSNKPKFQQCGACDPENHGMEWYVQPFDSIQAASKYEKAPTMAFREIFRLAKRLKWIALEISKSVWN